MSREKAIEKIKTLLVKHREVHLDWREFLQANPDQEEKYDNVRVGGIKHQEACIQDYDEALQALAELSKPAICETRPDCRPKYTGQVKLYPKPKYKGCKPVCELCGGSGIVCDARLGKGPIGGPIPQREFPCPKGCKPAPVKIHSPSAGEDSAYPRPLSKYTGQVKLYPKPPTGQPEAEEFTRSDLADVGERFMEIYEYHIPKDYHPANCPTEWIIDLLEKIDRLEADMEVIDAIARNTTKLTSPLYPTTIKMIRQKIKEALKEK